MIVENSAPRDSKRAQNGFPVVSNPDASAEHDALGPGPSNEAPPPTYEEAINTAEDSSSANPSASPSISFAPSRSISIAKSTSTPGYARSPEKYASQAGTSTLSPYASPAVTGYGATAQTAPPSETSTSLGRHSSVASYYAPSTSSGKSRADSDLPPSSSTSVLSLSSCSEDKGANVARSCSASSSTTHTTSSRCSRRSYPDSPSPSPSAASDGLRHSQTHLSPSTRAQSFTRPPANDLPYGSFPPATLHAYSDDLEADGFPKDPPTCACAPAPHPFVTHDVNEEDWASFLDDVRSAGGLSPVNGLIAGAAPIAVRVGIIGGKQCLRAWREGRDAHGCFDY